MNSTYDYLSSLLKEPKTQAYNQPASSTDTYSYLKSLLRPDADTVRVPSFSRSATGTDTYSYLKSLLRPDADVIYTPIQSTNNSNLDGVTLYTQDAVQNQQQSNVNNTQSAAEEQMIRDAVYMGGEPYTSKDQDDSNLRDAVYMGGEPYKSNGYDYNKWRDERINQLRWTANPEYSMDYQADLNELNRLISERDAEKAEYMAQPAAWTDSEKHARSLKQTDKWAYEDYITSDAYIGGNWNRWMTLAQPGKLLTTDEREEAKMAVQALGQVAEKLYWSHGDPTLLTLEEVRRYNTLTGLSGALASKESGMQAAILGGANIIPGEKISKVFHDNIPAFGAYQDSLYSDQNVADLMAKSNLSENAQAANPGIYTTANVAANIAAAAVGGELLAPLKAPQFVKNAIIFGAQGGINSAANQDWSKPWEAAGKTVLDTGISAATGVAAGMLLRKLY